MSGQVKRSLFQLQYFLTLLQCLIGPLCFYLFRVLPTDLVTQSKYDGFPFSIFTEITSATLYG